MNNQYLFSSESVSEGHPDKIADQISDAILDAIIKKDLNAHVACETLVKTGMVLVAGEVNTSSWVDIEEIVRKVIIDIGYIKPSQGIDGMSCSVLNAIGKQSPDIIMGIKKEKERNQGAGDQGIMFGFACDETDVLMPAPIIYANRLMKKQSEIRKSGKLNWLYPDAKTQITFQYINNVPCNIDTIIFSTQHAPNIQKKVLEEAVHEEIIKKVIPKKFLTSKTKYFINPTGKFTVGGPQGDCGLTGRKIITDTYGGMSRHGGGAFSGKDPSKVDRSAAYMMRYIAKNIVAAKLAKKCEIQISYAIGISEPISIYVNTFGTGKITNTNLLFLIKKYFSLKPNSIIKKLDLLRPIYQKTSVYGHFGREEKNFTWEKIDKSKFLKYAAKKI